MNASQWSNTVAEVGSFTQDTKIGVDEKIDWLQLSWLLAQRAASTITK